MPCYYGDPEEDIAEVANPAGEEEFQGLLDELEETRNLLLAYRLLHFSEKIPNIKLNIKGREKQLFKPGLRIFQNTETLNELLPVISNYVTQKREANDATFNAFLYKAIIEIIATEKTAVLASRLIWKYVMENLEATEIPGRNLSCETTEFGHLSQKNITETLVHIFGAKNKKIDGIKHLIFNTAMLQRLGKIYDLSLQVQVIKENEQDVRDDRDDIDTDRQTNEPTFIDKNRENEHEIAHNFGANDKENDLTDPIDRPDRPYRPEDPDPDKMSNADKLAKYEEAQAESLRKSKGGTR